ncbi:MAG TPA: rhodanese-like domain-containing protein, partial [Chthonomonadales bacterium]|nr:rhodanese-like domain-containing protein [Chthonomonadales bacterium]
MRHGRFTMFVRQFFVKGLAHSSYLLGGSRSCAIVDPQRDIEVYLDAAREMGFRITHILQTHLHADFVSGHMDLAAATGGEIVAPASAECAFAHRAVQAGDVVEIDQVALKVLDTPGHTPEHVGYVATDRSRGPSPAAVFCGDTLFVGDVGRPDLFPGRARELASKLYDSLHTQILSLPDHCEVLPAHGAGSLCGRAMSARRTSTIGYERLYNAALQIADREEFIRSLTTDMPPAPDHFARCSAVNGAGPALVSDMPPVRALPPADFARAAAEPGALMLDVRLYEAFAAMHVPGSWHIDLTGNFATFAGWLLPPDARVLLVCETDAEAAHAATLLRRVGIDRVEGCLAGSLFAWAVAGMDLGHVPLLSAEELNQLARSGGPLQLVDVRAPAEYDQGHIEGAANISAPDLRARHVELDRSLPTALVCSSGHRSSMGCAILKRAGFADVRNVAGGMAGYGARGWAPACPMCVGPHGPRVASAP